MVTGTAIKIPVGGEGKKYQVFLNRQRTRSRSAVSGAAGGRPVSGVSDVVG
jgi:hypothetical protein